MSRNKRTRNKSHKNDKQAPKHKPVSAPAARVNANESQGTGDEPDSAPQANPTPKARGATSDASPPTQNNSSARLRRARLLIGLSVAGLVIIAGAALWLTSGPRRVERTTALGTIEYCQSCHPNGKRQRGEAGTHPKIDGHADITRLGCTSCHGGKATTLGTEAHQPPPGGGNSPFFPLELTQVACARCHTPGSVAGMQLLEAGQKLWVESECVACHQPGARPGSLGSDLRTLAQRSPEYIKNLLLTPHATLADSAMWSLNDGTYKSRFDQATEAGKKNLLALTAYVLALGDKHGRKSTKAKWFPKQQRIDTPCVSCHVGNQKKATKGTPHRCPQLKSNAQLRCARCHTADAPQMPDADRLCPQIRASLYTCGTCHLREDSGARALVIRATRAQ